MNRDASVNQTFPQDAVNTQQQNFPNPMLQNSMNPWQQAQLAMSSTMLAQQFGQMPWPTQMPNPQIQNAMLQMAPMPFISQQILQEAFSMSQPVAAVDEPHLLTALLRARKSERNFKEALNGLHGTNGHSASLWKDYYLEHKDRLDDWIEQCMEKEKSQESNTQVPLATIKKPSPASFKSLAKPNPSSSSSSQRPIITQKPRLPSRENPKVAGRGRNTVNSLSVPEPIFGSRLPAPNAAIKVPVPPSRSPTPPTLVVPLRKGNKFTTEDRDFFIKFLGWRLQHNSDLNRQDLCEMLAEKAPHHTAASWGSFWSNNHDVPDKILAFARGEFVSEADQGQSVKKSRPNYKEVTTSEEDSEDSESERDSDCFDSDTESIHCYSESEMGEANGLFTDADVYFLAKHVGSTPDLRSKDRWESFHAKYPQRSAKSWAHYYRRYEKRLTKMAKKIQEANDISPIVSQLGRPSRVLTNRKRNRLSDSDDDECSEDDIAPKRTRIEDQA